MRPLTSARPRSRTRGPDVTGPRRSVPGPPATPKVRDMTTAPKQRGPVAEASRSPTRRLVGVRISEPSPPKHLRPPQAPRLRVDVRASARRCLDRQDRREEHEDQHDREHDHRETTQGGAGDGPDRLDRCVHATETPRPTKLFRRGDGILVRVRAGTYGPSTAGGISRPVSASRRPAPVRIERPGCTSRPAVWSPARSARGWHARSPGLGRSSRSDPCP